MYVLFFTIALWCFLLIVGCHTIPGSVCVCVCVCTCVWVKALMRWLVLLMKVVGEGRRPCVTWMVMGCECMAKVKHVYMLPAYVCSVHLIFFHIFSSLR